MFRFAVAGLATAEAATLAVTWKDCGATHATVTDLQPTTIHTGATETLTGTGTTDEEVTSAQFTATVSALGTKLTDCSGDATSDITCTLPMGVGKIVVKAVSYPLAQGTVKIPVDVQTSSIIPASLASVDVHISATDQNGESVICLDVHTDEQKSPATLEEMAAHINSLNVSWKAEAPKKFGDFDDVKMLCGTILSHEEGFRPQAVEKEDDGENLDIPTEFDVRTNWPDCASVSGDIRDQSACGSCWAFGSTEAFNDRLCIATGSTTLLSAADTTANCDLFACFSMGCGGGQPGLAWDWFASDGVVTGGDFEDIGKGTTCGPYPFQSCAHHVPATDKHPACPSDEYSTPSLNKCSEEGYGVAYADDKVKAYSSYSLNGVANIQKDIMQYGSATAAFTVYEDFPTYKSGVYRHTSGSQLGGHAIKLLGWGVEDGQDYWLVANSWNEEWGDHGTFKIARGNNECGIEGQVSAGLAAPSAVTV